MMSLVCPLTLAASGLIDITTSYKKLGCLQAAVCQPGIVRGTAPASTNPCFKAQLLHAREQQGIVSNTFGTHYIALARGVPPITLRNARGCPIYQ